MTAPRRFSPADIVAGVSVALILIPQSLAYAEIAGLPPYVGLFASAVPPIAAAFFASSPYLQTGPVAMTALLTFGALAPLATPETSEYIKLAALLALVVGVVRVAFGLFRSGVIAYFMSQPVLVGFTSAAAILICASQLPVALGAPAPEGGLLERAWWAIIHPGEWEATAVLLAVVSAGVVLGSRRIHKLFPGVLVAVVIGLVYSVVSDYDGSTVGDIPAGLPPFGVDLPWGDLGILIVPGIVIALVGFAEPAAIARVFAAQDRERWDPDREFISQGVANLASGFSGGFPIGGSFSRSSVNKLAGGRSRWSGAVTGLVVLAFLPIAGILEPLPRAVLGAIVISAVARLIRPDEVLGIFRFSIPQGVVASVTFVGTLVLAPRIERAVLIGIGLGIAIHLWRELHTHVDEVYSDGTLRLRPHGVLFFGSAPELEDSFNEQLARHPEARRLIVDLGGMGRVDYTGALALKALVEEATKAGLEVSIAGVPPQVRRILKSVWGGAPPLEETIT